MKTRREISELVSRVFAMWALMVVVTLSAIPAHGQLITPLIQFTNEWKYDRSGLELGTAWRTNDFDDTTWASGRGLLGYDDGGVGPYVIHVPSGFGTSIPLSQLVTTYYFRTTFTLPEGISRFAPGLQVIATNLMDDGGAIWLNGRLAGTVRLPSFFNAATLATAGPTDGQLDTVLLTNFLRSGINTLAVEVHQNLATGGDMVWAMRLQAVVPAPLVITNQPLSNSVFVGDPVTFQVGVSGGPVSYRWQKDGVSIANGTNSTYTISSATLSSTGNYRVICSNILSMVTSEVARLDVNFDLTGPLLLSAIADESQGPNRIRVSFSETLINAAPTLPYSPINPTNYILTHLATGQTVGITNIRRSGPIVLLELDGSDPDWVRYNDYSVTVSRVADRFTNSIAPSSAVPVGWLYGTNLVPRLHEWEYHVAALFDPGVYDEPWTLPDYLPGPWWARGLGSFYGVTVPANACATLSPPQTTVGWQPEPILFRTTFDYPTHWPAAATLSVKAGFEDGLVLYLNGLEIYRNNVPYAGTVPTSGYRSSTDTTVTCQTNLSPSVTNLSAGRNHLAAALVQSVNRLDAEVFFGLEIDAQVVLATPLPSESVPVLQTSLADTNLVRLSWTGGGYALESSTNLNASPRSYPMGPWTPVPRMSNPYHWPLTNGPQQFFRLRK